MMQARFDYNIIRYLAGSTGSWLVDQMYYSNGGISFGNWYHYAVARENGTTRVFLNGNQIDSFADSINYTNVNQAIKIGGRTLSDQSFAGYIDEVRVTKGLARYNTSFAPSNLAFENVACYSAGVERSCSYQEVGCSSTGYCNATAMYYINGIAQPGLNSSGTGVSAIDNKRYTNGTLANGLTSGATSSSNIYYNNLYTSSLDAGSITWTAPSGRNLPSITSAPSGGPNSHALYLSGSSGLYSSQGFGSGQNLDLTNNFTIEFWVYRADGYGSFTFLRGDGGADQVNGSINSDGAVLWAGLATSTGVVPQGQWVHLAMVNNGGNKTIFVNGVAKATGSGNSLWNGYPAYYEWGAGHDFSLDQSVYISNHRLAQNALYDSDFNSNAENCYTDGIARACMAQDYGCAETGYCPASWKYFVSGVGHPGLDSNGTGASSTDQQYYFGGVAQVGLDQTGSGLSQANGLYYLNGALVNGYIENAIIPTGFYLNGSLQTDSNHLGSSAAAAAQSAEAIKAAHPSAPNGVYWIDLPESGPTLTYCLMDDTYDGGGWMLMMKATRGNTFNYNASYWTANDTLNPQQTNTADGDAKFDVMNKFVAKDMMAIWPDIPNGGSIAGSTRGWTWLQKNFNDGTNITPIAFFATDDYEMNFGGSGKFISDAKTFSGWASGIFSSQVDIRFYGFNYRSNQSSSYAHGARVRWGFGWNENGEGLFPGADTSWYNGSNDVSGGIGMDSKYGSYSAGDLSTCCQDSLGINRSARVEIYVK
jgi:hypothetical protein